MMGKKHLLAIIVFICECSSPVQAQSVLQGPNIAQNKCLASQGIASCTTISYAANSPILQKRLILVPTGKLTFRFHLTSMGWGPTTSSSYILDEQPKGLASGSSFHYGITVTATGPNAQTSSVTKSASKVLHGNASADLDIPINVDWAESVVTFAISLSQTICPARHMDQKLHEVVPECWNPGGSRAGPDLSSVDLGFSVPFTLPKDAFLLLITPAAAFQSPIVPIGIAYAPLGSGSNARSSFAITQTIATNQGFTDSYGDSYQYTADDRTGYSIGLSVGITAKQYGKVNAGFTFSGSWDNATEIQEAREYGDSGSVVTSDQLIYSYTVLPSKIPLNQITWETQPFWRDLILAVINAQYALWIYPTGPIIQPLSNADVVALYVQQLHNCYQTPYAIQPTSLRQEDNNGFTWQSKHNYARGAMVLSNDFSHELVATKAGVSGESPPVWNTESGSTTPDGTLEWMDETDHFIPYAGDILAGETLYIWLSSGDCSNILSIDKFYVNKTQSSHPEAYRLISGGSSIQASAATTYSNTQQTIQTQGQSQTAKTTLKVTSAAVNSQEASFGVEILSVFGINYSDPTSSTVSTTYTATGASSLQSQKSLLGGAVASTTIQDSYEVLVPVNVMQDSMFMGMAVQDTNMHYPAPGPFRTPRTISPFSGSVDLPQEFQSAPLVPAGLSRAILRKNRSPEPQIYVRQTSYGYVVVKGPPSDIYQQLKASLHALHVEATKRHVVRPPRIH
jgi:hypothetical protein